jgi:hypothetical protein
MGGDIISWEGSKFKNFSFVTVQSTTPHPIARKTKKKAR